MGVWGSIEGCIDGWKRKGKSWQTKCIASVGRKNSCAIVGFCLCLFIGNDERKNIW